VIVACLTGLRSSELAGLYWQCVDFEQQRIAVNQRWAWGEMGKPKTEASEASVSMSPALADVLKAWYQLTPYNQPTDFVFASLKGKGKMPLTMSGFVCDHLRPAAIAAGVQIEKGQRFGLHNLRHSLSNWLVNKGKVQAKTVQGMLRHSKIATTLDLYVQGDMDEMSIAQAQYVAAVGWSGLDLVGKPAVGA
jgi:integrase